MIQVSLKKPIIWKENLINSNNKQLPLTNKEYQ